MVSRLVAIVASLMFVPSVFAIDEGTLVTKQTRERIGLDYSLSAVRESGDAVIVSFSVDKKGALKNLQRVQLQISDGQRIMLTVPLETEEQANGSLRVSFQLLPELADKAALCLYTQISKKGPAFASHYAVQLKEYIVSK